MKVSDYIADHLLKNGITRCFSVTGGFAMHLNDSFGEKLDVIYQHGEAPCGYSAMGYSKMNQEPTVVCVTAGCGATNAITPCLVAYQDSVPIFFISGAVPSQENVRHLKHSTRTYTGSDCDIIDAVKHMTKFSHELTDVSEVQVILDQCIWNLRNGRPGPVWLSIPLDVQSKNVPEQIDIWYPPMCVHNTITIEGWETAKRPLLLAGGGIRNSKTENELEAFVQKHQIPVVCSFFGTDLVPDFNVGRVGVIGDRTGNFVVQNADVIIVLGCRLSKTILGYKPELFGKNAKITCIDVEKNSTLQDFFAINLPVINHSEWLGLTRRWKSMWFQESPNPGVKNCPYTILIDFFKKKNECENIVVSSGSIYCVAWHTCIVKNGDRFISSGHGDMGYEVPAAIGCAMESGRTTWAIVGDGSFQLNVQELQTIKSLNVPVKILYFDNGGYGAIQVTQDSYFKRRFGVEVPCPDVKKVCEAWDFQYFTTIDEAISFNGPCLVNIPCIVQQRYPRLYNTMREDGTFENKPMDEMWPFVDTSKVFSLENTNDS